MPAANKPWGSERSTARAKSVHHVTVPWIAHAAEVDWALTLGPHPDPGLAHADTASHAVEMTTTYTTHRLQRLTTWQVGTMGRQTCTVFIRDRFPTRGTSHRAPSDSPQGLALRCPRHCHEHAPPDELADHRLRRRRRRAAAKSRRGRSRRRGRPTRRRSSTPTWRSPTAASCPRRTARRHHRCHRTLAGAGQLPRGRRWSAR